MKEANIKKIENFTEIDVIAIGHLVNFKITLLANFHKAVNFSLKI